MRLLLECVILSSLQNYGSAMAVPTQGVLQKIVAGQTFWATYRENIPIVFRAAKIHCIQSSKKSKALQNFFGEVTDDAKKLYRWLDMIVNCNLPFAFIENERTLKYCSIKPFSRSTITKYLLLLAELVRIEIKSRIPKSFGVIFDGWSLESEHYLSVYATWTNVQEEYDERETGSAYDTKGQLWFVGRSEQRATLNSNDNECPEKGIRWEEKTRRG